ncbi:MAG: LysR family transcriptional regulator [Rubrivivax sp.]|nr:MAG: LysR family transcriptional regulator [Rubrivivax sp.]
MNLYQLKFAKAVADTGSFTAASAQCFVTQPTLSNGIAQLEQELGERLFERTTRKVSLTAFGAHLLPFIAEVLKAQTNLVLQSQTFLRPDKKLIRIGTSPLVNSSVLGPMIGMFQRAHPEVEMVLREMNMDDLYRMLDIGQLDFVFGVADVSKGQWSSTFLYREPLLFIPRQLVWQGNHDLREVKFKDIADETYVMVPDACGLSRTTRALFRTHRRKLQQYSGDAMSYQVLEQWAELGFGAAILPKSKISIHSDRALSISDKGGNEASVTFEAVWGRAASKSPHLVAFANHLQEAIQA